MRNNHSSSIWNFTFIKIFFVNFVLQMGQFMMNTLVPKYVDYLGAGPALVGMVSSMFAITALAIRPIAGPAFDCFQKKKILMLAMIAICASYGIYANAGTVELVVAARLLQGVGMGCTAPLCLAIASDCLPDDKIGSGIGIFSLGQALASAVGPGIGFQMAKEIGYPRTFQICLIVMVIACFIPLSFPTSKIAEDARYRISLRSILAKEAVLPAAIMFFLTISYSCINYFVAIYGELCGVENISLFFTAYAIFLLVSRPMSGKLADQKGTKFVLVPAMLCFSLSMLVISFSRTLPMFLLAGAISAFGFGTCQPTMQALCMKRVPKERRGAGSNTNYIGVDLGYLVGPTLAGLVVQNAAVHVGEVEGYAVMYRVMILPVLIGLVIFLARKELWKNH